jgi:c-di-GMP-binding flagellar brake protein YcgR
MYSKLRTMQGKADRRQHQRLPVDLRVTWVSGGGSTVRGAVGRACDISLGGISVFLPRTLSLGEESELQFKLPTSPEPLRVRAVLRTRDSFRYGFEFVSLSAHQRALIQQLCQTLTATA